MAIIDAPERVEQQKLRLTAGLLGLFVGLALSAIAFISIARQVHEQETLWFDEAVLGAVHGISNDFLNLCMPIATDSGGVVGVSVMTIGMIALLVNKREKRRALMLTMSVVGAVGINLVLKVIFERARPDLWEKLILEPGFSFPSGHAMASTALGIALVVVLWESRWRWWILLGAIAYILFVGFSRLYLGVHYPTDIIAGWLVSGAWVMAVTLLLRSRLGNQVFRNMDETD